MSSCPTPRLVPCGVCNGGIGDCPDRVILSTQFVPRIEQTAQSNFSLYAEEKAVLLTTEKENRRHPATTAPFVEDTSHHVVYVGVEVVLLTSPLWGLAVALSGFRLTVQTISIVGTGVLAMAFIITYARSERSGELFPAWPTRRVIGDILVRLLGYNGCVGLGAIVGIVVATGLDSTALGASVSGLGVVWFFKHLNFFLELEHRTLES